MDTSPLKLSMICGPYDRAQALIDGTVKPNGIDLAVTINAKDGDRHAKAMSGQFDVVEFFTSTYIADLPFKKLGFTAIPIYVKRLFRHSSIYINKKSGIVKPSDLNGKRVGIQNWNTTAAVWAKGILEDDYGVDLASINWVASAQAQIPDWKPPSWLKLEILPPRSAQFELLVAGDIDCGITTELWAPNKHPDVGFLFPDYAKEERDYFIRTRCFPIMHILLVRTSILDAHPWVARSLFDAWEQSKQKCFEHQKYQRVYMTSLGYRALWEDEQKIAGPDIYPWGFAKSRHELALMLDYSHRQGLIPHRYQPEDLFPPSMLET